MKIEKVAVIGAGKMGSIHSRIYSQMDQVDLVAIVDGQLDKATALCEKYGYTATSANKLLRYVSSVMARN